MWIKRTCKKKRVKLRHTKQKSPSGTSEQRFSIFHLDVFAVRGEVDLDHEAGDVLTVTDPVEGRPKTKVVKIHSTFNWTHCQEAVIWTEPEPRGQNRLNWLRNKTHVYHWCPDQRPDLLPYVLDGDAAVSLLAPDSEGVDEQDDELAVLHADRNHLSVGAVGRALGRMTQTHLVEKFLRETEKWKDENLHQGKKKIWFSAQSSPYQPGPISWWSRRHWRR